MTNVETLTFLVEGVWVRADSTAVDATFIDKPNDNTLLPYIKLSPEDLKTLSEAIHELLFLWRVEVIQTVSDDDWVAMLVVFDGISQTDAVTVSYTAQLMARFEDGMIVELYNNVDFVAMFQQLGLIPDEAVARCLTGESLV